MGWPGPMTHRQFLTWQEWLAEQWNVPDRHDLYLMSVAHEARYSNREHTGFRAKDYLLDFKRPEKPRKPTKEELDRKSDVYKYVWAARFGIDPKALGVGQPS